MNSALLRTKHETSLSVFGNAWIFWICIRNIKSCIQKSHVQNLCEFGHKMQICYKSFRANPHQAIFCFCFMNWPASQFMKQKQNMAWCGLALCSRMVRFRGRPSEPLMFVWPGRKFVPLIPSVRTRLKLMIDTSVDQFCKKVGLVRIGPQSHVYAENCSQSANLCVIVFNMKL